MRKSLFIVIILLFGFAFQALADEPIGVFVNSNTNSLQFINPLTQAVSPSLLKGYLGSYGGGLFDVAITKNGNKAVISNFGDSKIFVIGIGHGFSATPVIWAEIQLNFFAEDMVFTADDKYLLVTDGGFSSTVAVIKMADYSVTYVDLGNNQAQACEVTPDGKTVLFADYWNMAVHSYAINSAGGLTYNNSVYLEGARPVNIAVAPDGQNALIANAVGYRTPVITFWGNGKVHISGYVTLSKKTSQSVVFNKTSTKAYFLSCNNIQGPNVVSVDIAGPGAVTAGAVIPMSIPRGTSQLFGVDTMAIDPSGNYLYVSNPTLSGGVVEITVIDLTTNTEVNQIKGNGIPTGIAFGTIMQ